ncbi:hypothetical protein LTR91_005845 [Friedmanniomyces endolithicus]|uniref:Uncharacterized protein n=1 Tax=Friedmanniomyces endolithicus TaxID=329885 RepID=A0AAN6QXI0_9PEZI|nr:hypothetical protein LTR57_022429 [Friedmanniomyces endolithicus]KAK0979670.1 hypothetical protein LTS01_012308 [Friedmanniomyces endolithicus]KAK0999907.1 hypothetical protein LTR91_005845 [Friedmanniomyces endolithicus]KAK1036835.1 hypothetical protein LTS16_013413 [Friedmanniomyces endolithicus]
MAASIAVRTLASTTSTKILSGSTTCPSSPGTRPKQISNFRNLPSDALPFAGAMQPDITTAQVGIAKLPPELLDLAFVELAGRSSDVHNVRLACSTFRGAAAKAFGLTFNRKVFHPLKHSSLECLGKLAKAKGVAPYVTKLHVGTGSLPNPPGEILQSMIDTTVAQDTAMAYLAYQHLCLVEDLWDGSGRVFVGLREAILGLNNLSAVEIVRVKSSQDPPSVFNPYADTTKTPELRLLSHLRSLLHSDRALRHRLRKLLVPDGIEITALPRGTYDVFHYPTNQPYREIRYEYALFPSLTTLDLHLEHLTPITGLDPNPGTYLPGLLRGMPHLRILTLAFPRLNDETGIPLYGDRHFSTLADLSPFRALHFVQFENLHLHSVTPLQRLLFKHAETLRHLHMTQMSMPASEWSSLVAWLPRRMRLDCVETMTRETKWLLPLGAQDGAPSVGMWRKTAKCVKHLYW